MIRDMRGQIYPEVREMNVAALASARVWMPTDVREPTAGPSGNKQNNYISS